MSNCIYLAKREPTFELLLFEFQLPFKKDTPPFELALLLERVKIWVLEGLT